MTNLIFILYIDINLHSNHHIVFVKRTVPLTNDHDNATNAKVLTLLGYNGIFNINSEARRGKLYKIYIDA